MPINAVERSKEIGTVLKGARLRAGRSIREISRHLGISIRRYSGIEQGRSYITAVELEELVEYLNVPPHEVWPHAPTDKARRRVVIEAEPGESVEVVVNITAERKAGMAHEAPD